MIKSFILNCVAIVVVASAILMGAELLKIMGRALKALMAP